MRRAALESARLSEEQLALRRIATLVAQSAPALALFEAVTREVGLLCGADLARLERYEEDGTVTGVAAWSRVPATRRRDGSRLVGPSLAREVRETGGPVRVASFAGATGAIAEEALGVGIRSSIGCPVTVAGRLWGVIAASTKSNEPFPANTESQSPTSPTWLRPPLRMLKAVRSWRHPAHSVAAADEARHRFERNLHDGAQQRLVSLAFHMRMARDAVPAELPSVRATSTG